MSSDFHNPGDLREAVVIQGSEVNFGNKVTSARAEQKELVEAALKEFAGIPLEAVPSIGTMPVGSVIVVRHNASFVGREADLRGLATVIKAGESTPAVTGLGGLGKTQLAAEFAHRYGRYFAGGVFWLNCSKPEDLAGQVARCGGAGGLALREDFDKLNQPQQVALVQANWSSALPRLLIFDHCEDQGVLERWRPTSGGARVLMTSLKTNWAHSLNVQVSPLGPLTPGESVALLRKHRPELAEDDRELAAIAETLGYLPLALHLAGSYLERYRYSAAGRPGVYLAELRRGDLLAHTSLVGGDYSPTGHELHVANTFALSWGKLEPANQLDALTRKALVHSSCFAVGEPIPRELLKASLGVTGDDPERDRLVEDALGRALELGLLEERTDGALALHRLLSVFVRREATTDVPSALDAIELAVFTAAAKLNQEGYPAPLRAWQGHLRVIADGAAARGSAHAGRLLNELGSHLRMVAEYAGARAAFERALAIDEKVYGPEHPSVATDVNNLGGVLRALGDLAGARAAFERALAILEARLPANHPSIRTVRANLASCG